MTLSRSLLMAGAALLFMPMAAATAAPPDDTIVIGLSTDANTFDPAMISARDNSNIARHIFATLYETTPGGELVPDLAESYEISEDGLQYVFTIQEGLTCEDGEALTAEDVAYSFNRAGDPENGFTGSTPGFVFSSIDFQGAEVLSEYEAAVNIGRPNKIALSLMAEVMIHCMDSYEAMSHEEAANNPVASGSYRLASWNRNSEIVLEKFREPGTFETIVWRVIPEASTRTAELIAGNVDIITNVAPDQVDAINNSGDAEVKIVQGTRRIYVGFNMSEAMDSEPGGPEIKNADVRRALQYAVDVPSICTQLLNFECERATGLVNPPHDHPGLEPYPYDPDMAEQLLDEAGYPRGEDGVRFSIKLQGPRGRYLNDVNVVQAIGQYLTDVGVETEVELLDFATVYVPMINQPNEAGPLFFLGTGGNLTTPLYDMTDLATQASGTNYTYWENDAWFDRWADIAAAETEEEERAIVDEMLEVFYEDSPWLLLYFQPDFYGVSNRVEFDPRRDERVYLFETQLAAQ